MIVPFNTKTTEKESLPSSPDNCIYCLLNAGYVRGYITPINDESITIGLFFTEEITINVNIPKKELPRTFTGSPYDYFFGDMYSDKSVISLDLSDDGIVGTLKAVYVDADPDDRVMLICCGTYPDHLHGFTLGIDEIHRYCEMCNKADCTEKNKKEE